MPWAPRQTPTRGPSARKPCTWRSSATRLSPVLSDHLDAGGFHKQFEHAGRTYAYGVVLNWSGNTADNIWQSSGSLPAVFAHELVEACSDPDGSTGYRLTPSQHAATPGENELERLTPDRRCCACPV